ncbi:MAG: RNA-directed DNA polymerase [Solirubrobacterales bacterium]|nr:RNA-directed DNA polymerase [Solirubrobacterales bacterium]
MHYRIEPGLIACDEEVWIAALGVRVDDGGYQPQSSTIVEKPKGAGHIRPGVHLEIEDQIVYSACVASILDEIRTGTDGNEEIDCSLKLSADEAEILDPAFSGWSDFRTRSLDYLNPVGNYTHCVVADITACYENIDIGMLMSDLRAQGCDAEILDLISKSLNRWANNLRGVPQGHAATDAMVKLYLTKIDSQLQAAGYTHLRYVDDFRVFCRSEEEAKRAMVELSTILRHRGLHLQSAKSRILTREDARAIIDGTAPAIDRVRDDLVEILIDAAADEGPYYPMTEIDELLATDPKDSPEVLEAAFTELIVNGEPWDKSIFHFLLNRLAALQNRTALEYCLPLLVSRPEETSEVLTYIERIGALEDVADRLAEFAAGVEASIYPYQAFEIVRRFHKAGMSPPEAILDLCRTWAFEGRARYPFMRRIARLALGDFGTPADLERLLNLYPQCDGSAQQIEIIVAIHDLERQRRNSFLSRFEGDGEWNRLACLYVKRHWP